MRGGITTCLIVGMLLTVPVSAVMGNELVTDLSTSEVDIQANFDGETVLLFGAFETSRKNASPDIVVIPVSYTHLTLPTIPLV